MKKKRSVEFVELEKYKDIEFSRTERANGDVEWWKYTPYQLSPCVMDESDFLESEYQKAKQEGTL